MAVKSPRILQFRGYAPCAFPVLNPADRAAVLFILGGLRMAIRTAFSWLVLVFGPHTLGGSAYEPPVVTTYS